MVKIILLGTGSIKSGPSISCTSSLISYQQINILVDAGPGTLLRLKEVGILPTDLDYIFLTHFHPDHISDLVPIIFYRSEKSGKEVSNILKIFAYKGFLSFMEKLEKTFGDYFNEKKYKYKKFELSPSSLNLPKFNISYYPMEHNPESVGYRFSFGEKVVAFSGDTGFCQELITLCNEAHLAVLECSYPDTYPIKKHLTPNEISIIGKKAEPKKIILTHLYPENVISSPIKIIKKWV